MRRWDRVLVLRFIVVMAAAVAAVVVMVVWCQRTRQPGRRALGRGAWHVAVE